MSQGKDVVLPIHVSPKNPINGAHVIMAGAKTYAKIVPVKAIQMAHAFTITSSDGIQNGKPGDYLVEAFGTQSRWVVPRELFEEIYTLKSELEARLNSPKHEA